MFLLSLFKWSALGGMVVAVVALMINVFIDHPFIAFIQLAGAETFLTAGVLYWVFDNMLDPEHFEEE